MNKTLGNGVSVKAGSALSQPDSGYFEAKMNTEKALPEVCEIVQTTR